MFNHLTVKQLLQWTLLILAAVAVFPLASRAWQSWSDLRTDQRILQAAGASVSSNPVTNSGVYVNLTAGTVTLTNNGVVNGGNPGVFVETLSAVPSTTSISITNANQITSAQDASDMNSHAIRNV